MARLSQNDIEELLRRPIISVVSTIRPDGTPHMTPVWHLVDDGDVVIAIGDSSVKARNVRANPKAALCVVTDETPQRWGLSSGNARLSTEGVDEFVRDISVHYMGEEEGARYAEQAVRDIDFVLPRITPTRTSGSDGEE